MPAKETIRAYYDAFNRQDMEAFFDLLHEDVIHDINQGGRQVGKQVFRDFMAHMNRSYRETLTDIVIMSNDDGTRGAAEFTVNGQYLATDEGLPGAETRIAEIKAKALADVGSIAEDTTAALVEQLLGAKATKAEIASAVKTAAGE